MPRRKKEDQYYEERMNMISRIIDILDLDVDNSFTLYELDNNEEKQKALNELLPDVKIYFSFGNIHLERSPRPYLMLARNVLKTKYDIKITDGGQTSNIRTSRYTLNPKE